MNETLYISKTRTLPPAQDFQYLRSEGLKYIEALAHDLWTDYNTHDPGVTILEALCYAITELSYRCDFAMKDLLADKDGNVGVNQTFYTAKTIFKNNPLTVEDYRKILIDIIGVHNAFMFPSVNVEDESEENIPSTEVAFYPDCKKDALVYNKTEHDAVDVRGLYKVLLDLDDSDEFGDFNIGNIFYSLRTADLLGTSLEIVLKPWREMDIALPATVAANMQSIAANFDNNTGMGKVVISYTDAAGTVSFDYTVRATLKSKLPNAASLIKSELENTATQQLILDVYSRKLAAIDKILNDCWKKLHNQRNLCEDFISIDTVEYTGVALCADIEAAAGADIEEILGNVYFLIQEYLSPTINFYLLQEMIAKGKTTDEIFEGPSSLEHGFIDTDELIAAQLRSEIRVSDIINLIQDIPGVVAVKNVLLTAYDDAGNVIDKGEKWCLHIAANHKPVLDIFRSKISFYKNRLPFTAKQTEALNVLRLLEANEQRPKLKGHRDDIELPAGTFYQLDDYLTVQYEFPQTYGISEYGLSKEVPYQRKAQALQLRAYLMFYDQLLANFFSQLYHAKDLFSLDTAINKTYFTQFLTGIKDVEDKIYREVQLPQVAGHSYSLKDVLSAPVTADESDADYTQKLWLNKLHEQLIESADMFDNRRNRFLDHLMARFAETFSNYVFLLYSADKERYSDAELINSKILFLKDYPVISSERGKAFDCMLPSWNTSNVSGLEKRVSRFSGIKDFTRRNLFCLPGYTITAGAGAEGTVFTFSILDSEGNAVLASVENYSSEEAAENILNEVYDRMGDKSHYKIFKNSDDVFVIQLLDDGGCCVIAQAVKTFENNLAAAAHLKSLIKTFKAACDAEGMHLIEHLLLRPRFAATASPPEDDYKLMQVCLEKDCRFCGEEDPYSFRASVYLPYWPARFRDMDFRRYIEEVFETEAPAHIAVKVCWLSYTSMKKFETIFQAWLLALADYTSDLKKTDDAKKTALKEANNKMVEFMAKVHSEYPRATLHDCEDGTANPVRLGSTVLGTF